MQSAGPDPNVYNNGVAAQKAKDDAAAAAQTANYTAQMDKAANSPGYVPIMQDPYEVQAGVTPPGFQGIVDPKTGQLLSNYTADPENAGVLSKQLATEAQSTGPTQWATAALGQQAAEEKAARGSAGSQAQTANDQANAQLMRLGGEGGGARTSLARSGARDALMAGQNVGQQGILARYGIGQTDAQLKQQLAQTGATAEQNAQLQNIGSLEGNTQAQSAFNQNRYNQQMNAWAALQQANATRSA